MAHIPFRKYHLLALLNQWKPELPLDQTVAIYFKEHKAIGSKDRRGIVEILYPLIRWQSTVDYLLTPPITWQDRLEKFESLELDPSLPEHIRLGFPKELYDLLSNSLKEKTEPFCLASNTEAPTTVRINPEKITCDAFGKLFPQAARCKKAPFGFTFPKREPFTAWPEYKEGLFEVQDEGSQLIAELVDAKPRDLVLDACAGSGGKSLAFAYKLKKTGKIFLYDVRKSALLEAENRAGRAGVFIIEAVEKPPQKVDWILIDAPCSATGTLRRHPDQRQRVTLEKVKRLVSLQRQIFKEAFLHLKPNGKIVYATCSVLKEENEEQLNYFLNNYPLTLAKPPFQSYPEIGEMDGFYAVTLQLNGNSSIISP